MSCPKVFGDRMFLSVSQAAHELSMSPATIRRWCDAGQLEYLVHPVNKYRFVSQDSVDRLKGTLASDAQPGLVVSR